MDECARCSHPAQWHRDGEDCGGEVRYSRAYMGPDGVHDETYGPCDCSGYQDSGANQDRYGEVTDTWHSPSHP